MDYFEEMDGTKFISLLYHNLPIIWNEYRVRVSVKINIILLNIVKVSSIGNQFHSISKHLTVEIINLSQQPSNWDDPGQLKAYEATLDRTLDEK